MLQQTKRNEQVKIWLSCLNAHGVLPRAQTCGEYSVLRGTFVKKMRMPKRLLKTVRRKRMNCVKGETKTNTTHAVSTKFSKIFPLKTSRMLRRKNNVIATSGRKRRPKVSEPLEAPIPKLCVNEHPLATCTLERRNHSGTVSAAFTACQRRFDYACAWT